jgi:hypothetical protein
MPGQPPVPGTNPNWLGQFLEAILAAAVTVLGADAPPRRFVSAGRPVPDCGQLTVNLTAIRSSGQPFTRPAILPQGSLEYTPVATLDVTLYECVAVATERGAPTVASMNADGLRFADLGQRLWYGLIQKTVDGTLFPLQLKPSILWRDMTPIDPQAGFAGWRLPGEISLT